MAVPGCGPPSLLLLPRPPLPLPLGARRVCRPLRGGREWVTLSMPVTPSGRWLVVYMHGRCSREQVKWGCCTPTPLGPTGPAVSALKPFSPGAGRAAGLSPGGHDVLTPPPSSHSAFQKSPQAGRPGVEAGTERTLGSSLDSSCTARKRVTNQLEFPGAFAAPSSVVCVF